MTTYYVATDGDNVDPGTLSQPWATLTYAESQLSDGDTVYVRGGTYHEMFTIDVPNVTFQNYLAESPVIDGQWTLPVAPDVYTSYLALVVVYANGVTINGFEMKNSTGGILTVYGTGHDDVTICNCVLHDCYRNALKLSEGVKRTLVEDCDIYEGAQVLQFCNYNSTLCRDLGYGDPSVVNTPYAEDAIFRRCKIHESWNEGLNLERGSDNITVEYCEIYGNRNGQLYIVSATNHTVRYNLIYGTNDHPLGGDGKVHGIKVNHESQFVPEFGNPIITNHKIYGNLVANLDSAFYIGGSADRSSQNMYVHNNTFIHCSDYGIVAQSGTGQNSVIKNNIIWNPVGQISNVPSGITFDYNLWSRIPDVDAQGTNDPTYADPQLIKTSGWTNLNGGELNGSEFALQSTSTAIDEGVNLGSPYNMGLNSGSTWVDNISTLDQDDYGTAWEIGAFVYGDAPAVPYTRFRGTNIPKPHFSGIGRFR